MERTADKVGGYNYNVNKINGTWDDEMGYGRINAFRAVEQAMLSKVVFTGNYSVCNTNTTYNITGLPSNVNFTWSVSSNLNIINSSTTSITVNSVSSSTQGYAYIEMNLSEETLRKDLWIGKPDTPNSITGPTVVNIGAIVNYRTPDLGGAATYQWWLPYPYEVQSPMDYFSQNWQLQAPGNTRFARTMTGYGENDGYVQVMGVNNCGTGGAKIIWVEHSDNNSGGGAIPRVDPNDDVKEVLLYPNPTKGKTTIVLTELSEYEGHPPTIIYAIKVLDPYLNERKFFELKPPVREKTLNLTFLPTGINYVIVYTDYGTFTTKLIID